MLSDHDLPLFAPRPVIAETPAKFRRAPGDPRDYRAELRALLNERPDIARWLAYEAVQRLLAGAPRVSVNALMEAAREHFATTINNSYRAALADWLVDGDPRLDALIERRRRKVTK